MSPEAIATGAAPERVTLAVSGMTCAACSARVQRALGETPGVTDASVNLMTGQATVDFDPAVTGSDDLVEAVRATGYDAEALAAERSVEDELVAQDAAREAEVAKLRGKL
ncbi:MAG TPA: heavy metal-associated domain-containing protein, partial [Gemmatimonadales bacterium]|nr:heavy metal-associated domain-containing protein [Gemmatimonadales bacterium]